MNFIYELTKVICTQENVNRANEYLLNRGLNPTLLKYSCVATGEDVESFRRFSNLYPVNIFPNSLYIPIVDIENPEILVGYDVKYLGSDSFRTRFHKFKIQPDTFLLYYSKKLEDIGDEEPVLVVESFIDAVTLEQLGYTVLSPLTALNHLKFCLFLYSVSNCNYIMYDNDTPGRKAIQKIMQSVSIDPDIQKSFNPVIYSGKDPNEVLQTQGPEYLKEMLKIQIGI